MTTMRDATLTLAIDSRQAQQGAAQFERAINQVTGAATRTQGAVGGLDKAFKTAALSLGAFCSARILTHAVGQLLGLASAAEEIGNKFGVVFGDLSARADRWADQFGDAVGRSQIEIKKAMAGTQDLFVPLGFGREQAFELSKALTELSIDVASFNNAMDADVMANFQSALVGNHETVRKYGIIISEAAIEQEAFRRGLHKTYSELTDQQKVLLRYSLIVRGSADAQGDAIRTADSYANQMKRLKAALADTGVELGEVFLPAASNALQGLNAALKTSRTAVTDWAKGFKEGVDIVVDAMEKLQSVHDDFDYRGTFERFGPSAQRGILRAYEQQTGETFGMTTRDVTGMMGGASVQEWRDPSNKEYARRLMQAYDRALRRQAGGTGATPSAATGPDIEAMLAQAGADGASAGPGAMYPSTEDFEAYTQNLLDSYHRQAEARRNAMAEMADMEQAVEREMEIIGRLSDSHAHAADVIEYATLANERYGEGTEEAAAATAKFEASIQRLARQEQLVNMAEDISRAFGQTFADLVTGAASAEDAFRSLGNQIIATMAQKLIADPIATGLMSAFSGMLGVPVMHAGGIVGQTPAPVRIVNPSVFADAPRLHSGLRWDEYPAILQKGEAVVPKGMVDSQKSAAPNVVFNIMNQSSTQVEAQQMGVQFDGRRMIVGMVLRDIRNNGPITRANRRRR